ncbi:deoxyribodipyrimidine photo-lyase [Idiomarina seosinensis]|uniref:deoxyribodipyrimidine photo-lyase n=1 Tax=Idiomarina seosinensis TaxID=281739 RepID=UPI00384D8969
MTAIVWFRHDLRIQDNPALKAACEEHDRVQGIFLLPAKTFKGHHWSARKADLLWRHLQQFKSELKEQGIALEVKTHDSFSQSAAILSEACDSVEAKEVYANYEYPVDEVQRDRAVVASLKQQGIKSHFYHGLLLIAPQQIKNKQGDYYKVFTPFNKAWRKQVELIDDWQPSRPRAALNSADKAAQVSDLPACPLPRIDTSDWPVGEQAVLSKFGQFVGHQIDDYQKQRDYPAVDGTSKLSAYLELGVLSPKTLARSLQQKSPSFPYGLEKGADTWLTELAWREFYQHLMYHEPRLSQGQNYQQQTQGLQWRQANDEFERWCQGNTGYPIVDAGMRQLNKTGWMHNRLRMITASFLVKDLLIDWRRGEQYFMEHLIDGSFAANNGGWQWSASVGTDAVPYFRVFNPVTQSERFDPDGDYIRTWIKELKSVPTQHIHWPHGWLKKQPENAYAAPIVDHSVARERFLSTFKQVKND